MNSFLTAIQSFFFFNRFRSACRCFIHWIATRSIGSYAMADKTSVRCASNTVWSARRMRKLFGRSRRRWAAQSNWLSSSAGNEYIAQQCIRWVENTKNESYQSTQRRRQWADENDAIEMLEQLNSIEITEREKEAAKVNHKKRRSLHSFWSIKSSLFRVFISSFWPYQQFHIFCIRSAAVPLRPSIVHRLLSVRALMQCISKTQQFNIASTLVSCVSCVVSVNYLMNAKRTRPNFGRNKKWSKKSNSLVDHRPKLRICWRLLLRCFCCCIRIKIEFNVLSFSQKNKEKREPRTFYFRMQNDYGASEMI